MESLAYLDKQVINCLEHCEKCFTFKDRRLFSVDDVVLRYYENYLYKLPL